MSEPNNPAQEQPTGNRSIIDKAETTHLPSEDPNVAASPGDNDHENHIGDPADDDGGVGEITARLDAGEQI